jgi:hypothetical protein
MQQLEVPQKKRPAHRCAALLQLGSAVLHFTETLTDFEQMELFFSHTL